VAYLVALFLALSPFHVWFSQEARMYTLMTFFSLACMAAYLKLLHRPSLFGNIAFVLLSGLAYITHYFALFFPLIQFIHIAIHIRRFPERLRVWTALQAIAALPILGWVYLLSLRPVQYFAIGWIPTPSWIDLPYTLANFTIGYFQPLTIFHWMAVLACLALVIFAVLAARQQSDPATLSLLVLWAFLPVLLIFLFSFQRPIYVDRYFIFSLPAFLILMSLGLASLRAKWSLSLAALLLVIFTWRSIEMLNFPESMQKEDWRQAANYLSQRVGEGDVVVGRILQVQIPFQYYPLDGVQIFPMEVNRQVTPLDELVAGYQTAWLLYWNATTHAHALGSKSEFDPQEETDPQAAAWINGHGPELLSRWDVPGLTIFHFEIQE
jgi:mannosyltransferase